MSRRTIKKGRRTKYCSSPRRRCGVEWLEVDSQDQLDHAAAGIIGSGKILIGVCCLSKRRSAEVRHAGNLTALATDLEVDIIKGVQELSPQLNVCCLSELSL